MSLRITREQFDEIYAGTNPAKYADIFFKDPEHDDDLLKNFFPSKLWRLNNLYTIVDKRGKRVRFNMNLSQHKVYAASLRHPRLIILKSRQQGISTLWLVSFFDDAISFNDFSIGLMAQGQDEAATLLERTKLLWETYPKEFKKLQAVEIESDNTKALSFSNGSTIFVRTSFRSTTLQRLHISEMGKIANKYPEKAQETKTGTLQAIAPGNTAVIESTAEGDNMFKSMWDNAMLYAHTLSEKDFMPVFLSWLDDPDCVEYRDQIETDRHKKYFADVEKETGITLTKEQRNYWIVQERELPDKIHQEYPTTANEAFMATKDGAYYAQLYLRWIKAHKRENENLYDANLDVHLVCDLGMNDTNTFIALQALEKTQIRFIDEICDNGQDIKYYCDLIKEKPWFPQLQSITLPHDAEVRELTSGKTRRDRFEEEFKDYPHIHISVLPRTHIADGIEQVRKLIPYLWIDPAKCEYTIKCLINYSKEWDDKRLRWRDKPEHNEFSHGADAVRYAALMLVDLVSYKKPSQQRRYGGSRGFEV